MSSPTRTTDRLADLLDAAERIWSKYGSDTDWAEWKALERALAAFGRPDGSVMKEPSAQTTKWRFDVEQGEGGWWYVTSPDRPGLLVVASTMVDAIAGIPARLIELDAAAKVS